jgi:REP element-mobilizing transposase RayT
MDWFKTMTTNAYIRGVRQSNWPPYPGRLWQRIYYERIIRNEDELTAIREYIRQNPMKWADDEENPANVR